MKRNVPLGMTTRRKHIAVLLAVEQAALVGCRGTQAGVERPWTA